MLNTYTKEKKKKKEIEKGKKERKKSPFKEKGVTKKSPNVIRTHGLVSGCV